MMYGLKIGFLSLSLLITMLTAGCVAQPITAPTAAPTVGPGREAESASATSECEEGFHLYDHELLATDPICIPENPQRIAFIDDSIAYAVALGVESITRSCYYDVFLGDFPGIYMDDLFHYVANVEPAEVSPNPFADSYPQPTK